MQISKQVELYFKCGSNMAEGNLSLRNFYSLGRLLDPNLPAGFPIENTNR